MRAQTILIRVISAPTLKTHYDSDQLQLACLELSLKLSSYQQGIVARDCGVVTTYVQSDLASTEKAID